MESKPSFTGRTRERKTRRSVLIVDRLAQSLISVGGIGTIVAVLGVFAFLVWVVAPLFLPAKVDRVDGFDRRTDDELMHLAVDEYQALAWTLRPNGRVEVFRLDTGELRFEQQLFEEGALSSASFLLRGDLAAFGLADGHVQLAEIGFDARVLGADQLPAEIVQAVENNPEQPVSYLDGVVERTPTGQYRVQRLSIELGEKTLVASGPVHLVRHVVRSGGPLIVAIAEGAGPELDPLELVAPEGGDVAGDAPKEGAMPAALPEDPYRPLRLVAISGEETSNFLTGITSVEFDAPEDLPFDQPPRAGIPGHLAVTGSGSDVIVAWQDGMMMRVRRSDSREAIVAEQGLLLDRDGTLESLGFVLGNTTLIWGDSKGRVRGGFTVPKEGFVEEGLRNPRLDDRGLEVFAKTKNLAEQGTPALALASSARSRLMLAGFADGEVHLYNVTNAAELASFRLPATASGEHEPVLRLTMSPKEDGLVAVTPSQIFHAEIDPRYPEASWAGLFRPVWYEGYGSAQHTWQSSSGTDDFETKLGLWPLIFGTLKATFYSMLFGAPLALFAAVFTSEFLHPKIKGVIKPSIELMASLPSVVLGFLAALVIAPFLETVVPATLAIFVAGPVAFLIGAYLWQLLPVRLAVRYSNWRFAWMTLAMPVGVVLAWLLGPLFESLFFGGDIRSWLAWAPGGPGDATFASSIGGWMVLWLPLSALIVALTFGRFVNPIMRDKSASWDRRQFALADLAKFLLACTTTVILALIISSVLDGMGLDPRGGFIDTYVQRNALIVGFVMGFAVIPIIYTISEDALQAVPEHLRSASLGAGATQWQTATRIIIPTAMSGLFSALMVGLGRAVGETMIVLMAAGNTPVLEWNIFNGFRTLSANIAVELPEAVKDSTHYRTLFLAALVLFIMTFAVNTVAEMIRLRFRKRAYQL